MIKLKKTRLIYSKCSVAIYISYKWQPSLNRIHAHGNDVRPVERKQNYAFSEKWLWILLEIIKDAGNMEKNKKPEACPRLPLNPNNWKSINLPQRQCNRYCSSPRHHFNINTINGGIKLSTQTSFMEKGTVQSKKSRLKEIITSHGQHKPSQKKLLWASPLKITML